MSFKKIYYKWYEMNNKVTPNNYSPYENHISVDEYNFSL